MRVSIAGRSHRGAVRETNQDVIDWRVDDSGQAALLVLADGMGGHKGGGVASRLAVDAVVEFLGPEITSASVDNTEHSIRESLERAFALANDRIRRRRAEEPRFNKMGTTLVVVWVVGNRAHIAHVGDSRCYRLGDSQPICLTRDDSVVQDMLEDGRITEADVPNAPFRNMLTRAVGSEAEAQPSYRLESLEPGELLLLCSDGLTDAVPENQWNELIRAAEGLDPAAQALIDAGLERQAGDNVSAVLLALADGEK